ncbi:hypothetical protein [Legionella cincinnatiensis]|uniref:Uncharacterized protein n=1 Tax=Legionella cincinnatiensis TaxID=28085 RepID=A0A378IJD6_9GAMM|nr:hypothetical protein [Legionella cincinnatiensis]KTC82076.1 hypothetical protein Lcin_3146 [Legionella cincinnatiensis]STX34862.1 Uncharacterised protein [Legionella cincinnatiensis]
MSDFKSKLPDLKELASITSKLYTDIKKSVGEIVQSYKESRAQPAGESEQAKTQPVQETQPPKEEVKTESKPVQEAQPIKEEVIIENKPLQEETPNPEEQAVDAPIKDDSKK